MSTEQQIINRQMDKIRSQPNGERMIKNATRTTSKHIMLSSYLIATDNLEREKEVFFMGKQERR